MAGDVEVAGFAEVEAEVTVVEGVTVMAWSEVPLAGSRTRCGAEITLEAAETDDPAAVIKEDEEETLLAEDFAG